MSYWDGQNFTTPWTRCLDLQDVSREAIWKDCISEHSIVEKEGCKFYLLFSFLPTFFQCWNPLYEALTSYVSRLYYADPPGSHWGNKSLWPAMGQSPRASWGYVWGPSVYDDSGSGWDLTTVGIFWIARRLADGWCLGGMGGRDECILGDTLAGSPILHPLNQSDLLASCYNTLDLVWEQDILPVLH